MRAWIAVATLVATFGVVGTAQAAVVLQVDGTAAYYALPTEANRVVVSREGNGLAFRDAGADLALVAGPGCSWRDRVVVCAGARTVHAELGDRDDTFTAATPLHAFISGGAGDDVLVGGSAADEIHGDAGNDVVDGGTGADLLDGGAGWDMADYSTRTRRVVVSLDGVRNDGEEDEYDNVVGMERVLGGSGPDVLLGDPGANELYGGPGDDSLGGRGGADLLIGGPGLDGIDAIDPVGAPGPGPDSGAPGNGNGSGDGGGGAGSGGGDGGQGPAGSGSGAAGSNGASAAGGAGGTPPDSVGCGAERDRVYADPGDAVGGDCEVVDRSGTFGAGSRATAGADPPVLGRSVVVRPVSGVVLVVLPGSSAGRRARLPVPASPSIPLDDERNIPIGSVVDTRYGTVEMTTAIDGRGTTQVGEFHSGPFQVFQDAVDGAPADLALRGGKSFASCPAGQRGPGRTAFSAARKGGKGSPVRRLWSSAKGKFRTSGRFAAATVRGTRWLTEDRCEGTLVRVTSGAVAVRDAVTGKTVVVSAGQQYLARTPRR